MDPTELQAAIWFGLGCLATVAGIVHASGFFPAEARPKALAGAAGSALLALQVLGIAALALLALRLAAAELSWTTAVVVGGLGLLAGPHLFQALPEAWRDSPAGVAASAAATLLLSGLMALRLA